jgi:hypothetical protein
MSLQYLLTLTEAQLVMIRCDQFFGILALLIPVSSLRRHLDFLTGKALDWRCWSFGGAAKSLNASDSSPPCPTPSGAVASGPYAAIASGEKRR